jgi:hypothetical protein
VMLHLCGVFCALCFVRCVLCGVFVWLCSMRSLVAFRVSDNCSCLLL